jgi:hypothetical protein
MNRLITSLVAVLVVMRVGAQQPSAEPPKLVISIVVDQLRGDYLQYFLPSFGEKGFKRLMNEGMVYHQVDFGFPNLGQSTSAATIYTGAYPYYHGVVGDRKFDFESLREVSTIFDNEYIGNFTTDRFSPAALLSSTIGDELRLATEGRSEVYAIAPNAEQAILSAGKYANAAFWLDDYNGNWATTTYYKNVPWYAERYNSSMAVSKNPERVWMPSQTLFNGFPRIQNTTPFKHTISKNDNDKYLKFKQTPFINTEVNNLVAAFFEYADFSKRVYPDLLALTYYAGNYKFDKAGGEYSLEIQDMYYRLDKEIERLLDMVDKKVGLKNVLIVLTSSGYYESLKTVSENFKPVGEFFPSRCTALLNMYLMAIYGSGNWVTGYYGEQIYLNKKLIEEQKIDWHDILHKSAEFVAQFSGIQEVTTSGQWMVNDDGRSAEFRRGMNKKISGDLFLELQPGWVVINDNPSIKSDYLRQNLILSPLFIFGDYAVKKESIYRKIMATEIAPTIAFIMRIRAPNSCKEAPLQEFIK